MISFQLNSQLKGLRFSPLACSLRREEGKDDQPRCRAPVGPPPLYFIIVKATVSRHRTPDSPFLSCGKLLPDKLNISKSDSARALQAIDLSGVIDRNCCRSTSFFDTTGGWAGGENSELATMGTAAGLGQPRGEND